MAVTPSSTSALSFLQAAPPPEIQWILAGISVLALFLALLALPTVFQMFWGRPRLVINFGEQAYSFPQGEGKALMCLISNPPVESPVLRKIGVRRAAADDVFAGIRIYEEGTNRVVIPHIDAQILVDRGMPRTRCSLPPSIPPFPFIVIAFPPEGGPLAANSEPIQNGAYYALIIIGSADQATSAKAHFVVGRTQTETCWGLIEKPKR